MSLVLLFLKENWIGLSINSLPYMRKHRLNWSCHLNPSMVIWLFSKYLDIWKAYRQKPISVNSYISRRKKRQTSALFYFTIFNHLDSELDFLSPLKIEQLLVKSNVQFLTLTRLSQKIWITFITFNHKLNGIILSQNWFHLLISSS